MVPCRAAALQRTRHRLTETKCMGLGRCARALGDERPLRYCHLYGCEFKLRALRLKQPKRPRRGLGVLRKRALRKSGRMQKLGVNLRTVQVD